MLIDILSWTLALFIWFLPTLKSWGEGDALNTVIKVFGWNLIVIGSSMLLLDFDYDPNVTPSLLSSFTTVLSVWSYGLLLIHEE